MITSLVDLRDDQKNKRLEYKQWSTKHYRQTLKSTKEVIRTLKSTKEVIRTLKSTKEVIRLRFQIRDVTYSCLGLLFIRKYIFHPKGFLTVPFIIVTVHILLFNNYQFLHSNKLSEITKQYTICSRLYLFKMGLSKIP
jgi:hypothetical protein